MNFEMIIFLSAINFSSHVFFVDCDWKNQFQLKLDFEKIRIELQIFLCGIYCEKNLSGFFDSYMDRFELKCEMLSVQVAISVNYKFGHEWMNIAPIIDGSFSLP